MYLAEYKLKMIYKPLYSVFIYVLHNVPTSLELESKVYKRPLRCLVRILFSHNLSVVLLPLFRSVKLMDCKEKSRKAEWNKVEMKFGDSLSVSLPHLCPCSTLTVQWDIGSLTSVFVLFFLRTLIYAGLILWCLIITIHPSVLLLSCYILASGRMT